MHTRMPTNLLVC